VRRRNGFTCLGPMIASTNRAWGRSCSKAPVSPCSWSCTWRVCSVVREGTRLAEGEVCRNRKARTLLKLLAVERGRLMSVDQSRGHTGEPASHRPDDPRRSRALARQWWIPHGQALGDSPSAAATARGPSPPRHRPRLSSAPGRAAANRSARSGPGRERPSRARVCDRSGALTPVDVAVEQIIQQHRRGPRGSVRASGPR
jgi:hypothetical protein